MLLARTTKKPSTWSENIRFIDLFDSVLLEDQKDDALECNQYRYLKGSTGNTVQNYTPSARGHGDFIPSMRSCPGEKNPE